MQVPSTHKATCIHSHSYISINTLVTGLINQCRYNVYRGVKNFEMLLKFALKGLNYIFKRNVMDTLESFTKEIFYMFIFKASSVAVVLWVLLP